MPLDGSLSERLPTPDESEKAKQASGALARLLSGKARGLSLRLGRNGREETVVELPPAVGRMVLDLLLLIGKGEAVALVPFGAELTTQQAADLLNVSRPFLIKLINQGKLECHMVGTHRRIRAEDLFRYKRDRDTDRRAVLRELTRLGQEMEAE